MKNIYLDTSIIISALAAPIMPSIYAKQLVIVFLGIFVLRLMATSWQKKLPHKAIIFALLISGIAVTAYTSPENLRRFVPVLLLIFGFPFSGLTLSNRTLMNALIVIIGYLVVTQIFIALGNVQALMFRDAWYPIENNAWAYGNTDTLFFEFREFRAAGIFYNPNLLGLYVTLYFFLYASIVSSMDASVRRRLLWSKNAIFKLTSVVVIFSTYLTGSRTSLIALLVFLFLNSLGSSLSLKSVLNNKRAILFGFFGLAFSIYYLWEKVSEGIFEDQGSANIKYRILWNYVQNADLTALIIGGDFSRQFDAEYGYWLGATGLLGVVGLGLMLRLYYLEVPVLRPFIVAILLMAIGNSVFYGLPSGTIATMAFVTLSALHKNASVSTLGKTLGTANYSTHK